MSLAVGGEGTLVVSMSDVDSPKIARGQIVQ